MQPFKLLFPVAAGMISTPDRYVAVDKGYAEYVYTPGYVIERGSGYLPKHTRAMNVVGALWAALLSTDLPVQRYTRATKAADKAAWGLYRQRMRFLTHDQAHSMLIILSASLDRRQRIAGYMIGLMPNNHAYDAAGALTRACDALGYDGLVRAAMASYLDGLAINRYGQLLGMLAHAPLIDICQTALEKGDR